MPTNQIKVEWDIAVPSCSLWDSHGTQHDVTDIFEQIWELWPNQCAVDCVLPVPEEMIAKILQMKGG